MTSEITPAGREADDRYGWALDQAGHLRAARWDGIDREGLADEVEGIARGEFERLVGTLRVLLIPMLKWDQQPDRRSRSWSLTVAEQRCRVARALRRSPSLADALEEALADAYGDAVLGAARETGLAVSRFPAQCPYTWSELTERAFHWEE